MADKLNLLNPNAPSFPDDGYDSLGKDGKSIVHYIHQSREQVYMHDEVFTEAEYAELIRDKYIKTPPEGYTSDDIRAMSDDSLLDMDYFLNE